MAGNTNSHILTLNAVGVFSTLAVRFRLITSEIENFSTRNFVTFPETECRIRPRLKIFKISNLGHVTLPYLVSRHGKQAEI